MDAPRPLSRPVRNSLIFKTDNIFVEESKPIVRLTEGFVNKKGVTELATKAPSTRARGLSSHQQPLLEIYLYETPEHAERAKILEDRKVIHERTIKYPEGTDTFEEWILARIWDFMFEPSTPINLSWVRSFMQTELRKTSVRGKKIPCFLDTIEKVLNVPTFKGRCGYSDISSAYNKNELDMDEVLRVIGKEGATWWEDPRAPIIPARPKKKILNNEAWMWLKLIVCNIIPTGHETTLRMEIVLLIYALMKNVPISLPSAMNFTMNADPTKSKTHLLPYPMFITKWAQDANVPRFPGDEILKIPKFQQFFPFGKWREEDEEVAHPIPPPIPSPVPPPAASTDIPAPSAPSSPEPSRRDRMRALRWNERIMCRHEQLMLTLHPGLDTLGLEQISFLDISQNQQEQRTRTTGRADAEEEDDFQSAEATTDDD
ncbi:hypothetical protein PIB30_076819 [Stylosanthes scabra]|uniref:Putative plant transposon protein domain-containing protein n=1 Tax=Stylosanthes scabra TaxID=79078 RepID=A0ABU6ZPM6_9FABA|nr:hypothetical protein [Stylosanthes scabra]